MRVMERFHCTAKLRHLAPGTIAYYRDGIEDFLRFHRVNEQWRHRRALAGQVHTGAGRAHAMRPY